MSTGIRHRRLSIAGQRDEVIDVLAGGVSALLLLVVLLERVGSPRLMLVLVFTFFVPGRAIVSNWPRMAAWSSLGMSIALSLGLLTAAATGSLWMRAWHPIALFELEAVMSLGGLTVAVVRRRRGAAGEPGVNRSGQHQFSGRTYPESPDFGPQRRGTAPQNGQRRAGNWR